MKKIIAAIVLISIFAFAPAAKKAKKKIGKFVLIESPETQPDSSSKKLEDFYIFNTEVTNIDYAEFLYELKKNNPEAYKIAMYDSLQWGRIGIYYERYAENYHKHQAYENYPVLNISKQAAEMYCAWLAERLKTVLLKDADFRYEVRLPTKAEWQYAASGGFSTFLYAWGGTSLFDNKGYAHCSFNNMSAQNIFLNRETGKMEVRKGEGLNYAYALQPNHAKFYKANPFGLYEVCGNVAEMISDGDLALGGHWNSAGGDVQIKSEMPYDGAPSSFVGFRPVLILKK